MPYRRKPRNASKTPSVKRILRKSKVGNLLRMWISAVWKDASRICNRHLAEDLAGRVAQAVPEAEDFPVLAAVNPLMNARLIAKTIRKSVSSLLLQAGVAQAVLAVKEVFLAADQVVDFLVAAQAAARAKKSALRIVKIILRNAAVEVVALAAVQAVAQGADFLAAQAVAPVKRNAKLIARNIRKNVVELERHHRHHLQLQALFLLRHHQDPAAAPAKQNARLIAKLIRKNAVALHRLQLQHQHQHHLRHLRAQYAIMRRRRQVALIFLGQIIILKHNVG